MRNIDTFLDTSGWADATRTPLAGDASARRYERIVHPRLGRAVLMDALPETNSDTGMFVHVGSLLRDAGLSAPAILAQDLANGFLLLEDLGDDLFARVVTRQPEEPLYEAAVDVLAHLFDTRPPLAGIAPYACDFLRREALLAVEWYQPLADDLRAEFDMLVSSACDSLSGEPSLVLRDYHAENLIWLPNRADIRRVGLLDFQGALAGHPAYDLVSLVRDARRDVDPALAEAMVAHFLARTRLDAGDFRRACAVLGAQRNLKIIGLFVRLCQRDRKPEYLKLLPRVWRYLQGDLQHPFLAPLRAFVTTHLSPPTPAMIARLGAGT